MKYTRHLTCLFLVLGASSVRAQIPTTFVVQTAASAFTWTGTSTLGPIVGNPSNQFNLTGSLVVDATFQAGPQPVASAAFNGGTVGTTPDIHGRVNNPIPGFPPLATIDVVGLTMTASSPVFAVAANGSFSALLTLTATGGTLTVDPLVGTTSTTPLAGSASAPTTVNGTLSFGANVVHLVGPVNSVFPFSDATTGSSGTITLIGTVVADLYLASAFCAGDGSGTACPCGNNAAAGSGVGCLNSLGVGARLVGAGLPSVSADGLLLTGTNMPATATALYFQGTTQANAGAGVAFGDGKRCAGGTVIRLATKTNAGGASSYPGFGDSAVSVRGALPAAGGTRTYQAWYRNSVSFCTADTFNLTNGVYLIWLP